MCDRDLRCGLSTSTVIVVSQGIQEKMILRVHSFWSSSNGSSLHDWSSYTYQNLLALRKRVKPIEVVYSHLTTKVIDEERIKKGKTQAT